MAQSSIEELVKLALMTGLGVFGKAAVDWWLARQAGEDQRKVKATADPAQIVAAGADFQEKLVAAAKDLLEDYRNQLTFVRARCEELEDQLKETRKELAATNAELARSMLAHSNCEEALSGMREQIAALMAERALTEPVPIGRPPIGAAAHPKRRRRNRPAKGPQP